MTDFSPLVSVIIPVYNQAGFLRDALISAQNQTYSPIEIIVVDDGSTDNAFALVQSFATNDPRVHYFKQANQGPSIARNQGIKQAKGDFICLLDADDCMETQKIERQLAVFQDHPDVDIVYTALYIMDQSGRRIGEVRDQAYPPLDFLTHLFFRNIIPNPNTIMAKRELLIRYPYRKTFKHAEDYELMLRLAHHSRFYYLDYPLTSYRRHSNNLSNDLFAHRQAELNALKRYSQAHIDKAIEASSLNAEDKRLMKGKILFNKERFLEASRVFQTLETGLSYFYLGNCWLKRSEPIKAVDSYRRSLELDPSNPACYNNLGAAYVLTNRLKEANSFFERALQLKPGYLDASYNARQSCQERFEPKITFKELRKDLLPYL